MPNCRAYGRPLWSQLAAEIQPTLTLARSEALASGSWQPGSATAAAPAGPQAGRRPYVNLVLPWAERGELRRASEELRRASEVAIGLRDATAQSSHRGVHYFVGGLSTHAADQLLGYAIAVLDAPREFVAKGGTIEPHTQECTRGASRFVVKELQCHPAMAAAYAAATHILFFEPPPTSVAYEQCLHRPLRTRPLERSLEVTIIPWAFGSRGFWA